MVPSLPEELLVSIFDYLALPEHVLSNEDLEVTDTDDEPLGVDFDNRQEFHERLATLRNICLVSPTLTEKQCDQKRPCAMCLRAQKTCIPHPS